MGECTGLYRLADPGKKDEAALCKRCCFQIWPSVPDAAAGFPGSAVSCSAGGVQPVSAKFSVYQIAIKKSRLLVFGVSGL